MKSTQLVTSNLFNHLKIRILILTTQFFFLIIIKVVFNLVIICNNHILKQLCKKKKVIDVTNTVGYPVYCYLYNIYFTEGMFIPTHPYIILCLILGHR